MANAAEYRTEKWTRKKLLAIMESYLWKFYNLSWSFTGQREVRGQAALIDGFADTEL